MTTLLDRSGKPRNSAELSASAAPPHRRLWLAGITALPLLLTIAAPALSVPVLPSPGFSSVGWLMADRGTDQRAEATCINAVEDQGVRVTDILDRNRYEGGSEVILRVQQRNRSYTIGCDYADNTRQVQLYRLEGEDDQGYDRYGQDNYGEDNYGQDNYGQGNYGQDDRYNRYDSYDNERVNNRQTAEEIARRTVQEQLGVDADSEVIRISETRRSDRQWYVRGDVNGAPFAVQIDRDGSVENFELR